MSMVSSGLAESDMTNNLKKDTQFHSCPCLRIGDKIRRCFWDIARLTGGASVGKGKKQGGEEKGAAGPCPSPVLNRLKRIETAEHQSRKGEYVLGIC
jgi:hypothetical protein